MDIVAVAKAEMMVHMYDASEYCSTPSTNTQHSLHPLDLLDLRYCHCIAAGQLKIAE